MNATVPATALMFLPLAPALIPVQPALADTEYDPRTYLYEYHDWEDSEDVVYGYNDDIALSDDQVSLYYEDWNEEPLIQNERVFGNLGRDLEISGDEWEEGYHYGPRGRLQHGIHREEVDYAWEIRDTRRIEGFIADLNLIRGPGQNQRRIVAGKLETREGVRGVIFGPAEQVRQLRLQVGDRIILEGQTRTVEGVPTLEARRAQLPGGPWINLQNQ